MMAPAPPDWIETPRLRLRPYAPGDWIYAHSVFSDPKVLWWRAREGKPPMTEPATRSSFQALLDEARGGLAWFPAFEKAARDCAAPGSSADAAAASGFIGHGVLRPLMGADGRPDPGGEIEIGYHLRPAAWGRGYATEVARALVDHAFARLGLTTLVAVVLPENMASLAIVERKLRMRRDGQHNQGGFDHIRFTLTRTDWEARPHIGR
jgi:RimJ/RimL family protein N-acetyltransferase